MYNKFIFIITSFCLLISQASFANSQDSQLTDNQGKVYTGVQLGYANMNYGKDWLVDGVNITSVGSVDDQGIAGRLYVGYNFNQYVAAEIGVLWLPKVKFNDINMSGLNENFKQAAVDVFVKGTKPLSNKFDIFGKVGVASFARSDLEVEYQGSTIESNEQDVVTVAAFGIGAQYHLTSNILVDASYTRYLKRGDLPATDFAGIGIAYQF